MGEMLPPGEIAIDEWTWTKENDPVFHRSEFSPALVKFYDKLCGSEGKKRVFVPLCGKTMDMMLFANKGHEVVGLEFSRVGIEGFFEENKITYSLTNVDKFAVYRGNEKNVTIYQGDLFDLNPDICGVFDAVWDRGSYVAINVPQQKQYADLMQKLIKPDGRLLLEATTYDVTIYSGPPHFIDEKNLQKFFGANFVYKVLDKFIDAPKYFPNDVQLDVTVYLIQPKQ